MWVSYDNWREHNGDTTDEYEPAQCEEDKPICWHCCKPIEDYEEYEVIDGDMYYHVGCLID